MANQVKTRTLGTKVSYIYAGKVMQRAGEQNLNIASYLKSLIEKDFNEMANGGKIKAEKEEQINLLKAEIKNLKEALEVMQYLVDDKIEIIDNLQYKYNLSKESNSKLVEAQNIINSDLAIERMEMKGLKDNVWSVFSSTYEILKKGKTKIVKDALLELDNFFKIDEVSKK